MDLTTSKNPNSMVLASAKIEITKMPVAIDEAKKTWTLSDLQDLGLARGVKMSFSSSKIDIKADNGTVPLKGLTDVKAKVEFSLLERHLPMLNTVMAGLVEVAEIGTGSKETKTLAIDNLLEAVTMMPKKNYFSGYTESDAPNVLKIKVAGGELDKKYFDIEKDGDGWFITVKPTDEAVSYVMANGYENVTVEYNSFRLTGYRLTKGSGGVAQSVAMKLTNKRKSDDGRIISRTFEFPYGFYDGDDAITFKSKNDADNVAEVPMSFEFSPHPDMLSDDFANQSLYRETQDV